MSDELCLRPHHGLCLQFYGGSGYSEEFCGVMSAVEDTLAGNPTVRLTAGEDALCRACPSRFSLCSGAAEYDRRVLELCGLETGHVLRWQDWKALLQSRILSPGLLRQVCGDCRWASLCGKTES